MMATLLRSGRAVQQLGRAPAAAAAAAAATARWSPRPAPRHLTSTTARVAGEAVPLAAGDTGFPDGAPAPPPPAGSPPVFSAFSVYKTRGAMSVKPIKPTWAQTPGGGYRIDREGTILFEIAPSMGERRYDWEKKVSVSMRAEEVAAIMAAPEGDHNFYHDTFKGQAGREGTLTKSLRWSRAQDGQGYYINAKLKDAAAGSELSASVSLTNAEFYLLRQLVNSSFLYLKGWDAVFTAA